MWCIKFDGSDPILPSAVTQRRDGQSLEGSPNLQAWTPTSLLLTQPLTHTPKHPRAHRPMISRANTEKGSDVTTGIISIQHLPPDLCVTASWQFRKHADLPGHLQDFIWWYAQRGDFLVKTTLKSLKRSIYVKNSTPREVGIGKTTEKQHRRTQIHFWYNVFLRKYLLFQLFVGEYPLHPVLLLRMSMLSVCLTDSY